MFFNLILFFIFNNFNVKCCCFCEKRKNNSITIDIVQNNEESKEDINKKDKKKDKKEEDNNDDNKDDDVTICKNKNEFIKKFNERKNKLIETNYFKSKNLINKLKADLNESNVDSYFTMYQEMTADEEIFNHKISLDLQIYRYILDLEGLITILDNIIKDERIQYWVIDKYDIKNPSKIFNKIQYQEEIVDENNINFKFKIINEEIKDENNVFRSGDCYIDEEKFKYLRCDGCDDKNCLSCHLRNLLIDEGLFKKEEKNSGIFVSLYNAQADSSHSDFSKKVKNIIYNGLKDNLKNTEFFTKYDNNELNENVEEDIRKSFFIEWALTVEFLKRFDKNILKNDNFKLYRTLTKPIINNLDLFESTSMCCPVFISSSNRTNTKTLFFYKTNNVNYFRCIFNYIISPLKASMFTAAMNVDYELEVGYIPLKKGYKWLNDEKNMKELKDMFNKRNQFIEKVMIDFIKSNVRKFKKYNNKNIKIYNEDNLITTI